MNKPTGQHYNIAQAFLSLPKGGLTIEEIGDTIQKKCGGNLRSIFTIIDREGRFAIYLGVIKKEGGRYYKV